MWQDCWQSQMCAMACAIDRVLSSGIFCCGSFSNATSSLACENRAAPLSVIRIFGLLS